MIDAILHLPTNAELPTHLTDDNGSPALSDPQTHNAAGDRLHYVRLTAEQLDEWRPYATVLAEAAYSGTARLSAFISKTTPPRLPCIPRCMTPRPARSTTAKAAA